MKKRIQKKYDSQLKEWHALIKESQLAYDKAKACGRYSDIKVQLFDELEKLSKQHADWACQAAEQLKQLVDKNAEKKDHCNTVAVVVLLLLLPLCGVLMGFYLATVTR